MMAQFTITADTKEELLDFALAEGLKSVFEEHKEGAWLHFPFPPCVIIRENWPHYDELLNWIEEKEKADKPPESGEPEKSALS